MRTACNVATFMVRTENPTDSIIDINNRLQGILASPIFSMPGNNNKLGGLAPALQTARP